MYLFICVVDRNRLRLSYWPSLGLFSCNYSDVISVTFTGRCKEVEHCGVDSDTLEGKTEIKTRCKKLKCVQ